MSQNILDKYTINREMPKNYVHGELDFCKSEFSYNTYDVSAIELKNCVVNYRGFVYEEGKFMLNRFSLLDDKPYKNLLTVKHYIKKVLIRKKRALGNGKYLLVYDDWTNAHYHWFCDLLPRLFSIKESVKDYILLLPDTTYIKDVGLASLDSLD